MLGRQTRWSEDLFVVGPVRDVILDDHILKRLDSVLPGGVASIVVYW